MAAKTSPSTAPPEIAALVEKFAEHRETYHRPGYDETQLRHDSSERQIDALVYELYGLTAEEIALVEEGTA